MKLFSIVLTIKVVVGSMFFIVACSSSEQDKLSVSHDGLMCGLAETEMASDKFQAKNAALYGLSIEEAQSNIVRSIKEFEEKCDNLSDRALKGLFQKKLAKELGQGSVEVQNDTLHSDPKMMSGKRYSGQVSTLQGYRNFSAYISPSEGIVVRLQR